MGWWGVDIIQNTHMDTWWSKGMHKEMNPVSFHRSQPSFTRLSFCCKLVTKISNGHLLGHILDEFFDSLGVGVRVHRYYHIFQLCLTLDWIWAGGMMVPALYTVLAWLRLWRHKLWSHRSQAVRGRFLPTPTILQLSATSLGPVDILDTVCLILQIWDTHTHIPKLHFFVHFKPATSPSLHEMTKIE